MREPLRCEESKPYRFFAFHFSRGRSRDRRNRPPPPFPLARSPPHNFVNLKMAAVMNISLAAKVVKAPKVRVKNGCIRNSSRVTGDARRLYVSLRRAEPRRKAPRAL